jgi:hypothetical protein
LKSGEYPYFVSTAAAGKLKEDHELRTDTRQDKRQSQTNPNSILGWCAMCPASRQNGKPGYTYSRRLSIFSPIGRSDETAEQKGYQSSTPY